MSATQSQTAISCFLKAAVHHPCSLHSTSAQQSRGPHAASESTPTSLAAPAGVLICGGGPAGYTTAIALAQQGYPSIHILEQAPGASFFDSSKAFTFALSHEGKGVLRRQGVAGIDSFGLCLNGMSMKMVHPDSKIEQKVMMKAKEDMDDEHANTWLPRHVLNSKLCEHVLQHHSGAVTVRSSPPVSDAAGSRGMQALGAHAHGAFAQPHACVRSQLLSMVEH